METEIQELIGKLVHLRGDEGSYCGVEFTTCGHVRLRNDPHGPPRVRIGNISFHPLTTVEQDPAYSRLENHYVIHKIYVPDPI